MSDLVKLQKLEKELSELDRTIKAEEAGIKFLKIHINSTNDTLQNMQATLVDYHSSSAPIAEGEEDISHTWTEWETIEQILKRENTAAGILCQLRMWHGPQAIPLTKGVLGIVALLGKVNDDTLSRLLSEYLGLETMLAVVCTTYDDVKALETYDGEGSVYKGSGLHGLGASIGRPLAGRFLVICLEDLRPYVGEYVADSSQRRLDLLKPKISSGESPPGFLGFAVNMIHVDSANLFCLTTSGHGLRETLFYHLFSHLQVYRTRAEMLQARPLISHGAVSMDGGIIRSSGVFSFGCQKNIDIKFPSCSGSSYLPSSLAELEVDKFKKIRSQKEIEMEDLKVREQKLLWLNFNYNVKRQKFIQLLLHP